MTPNPLDELDELEAKQRHPAGQRRFCPQTGRALPQRVPASPAPPPSRGELLTLAVVWGAVAGGYGWAFAVWLTGGAL